MAILNWLLSQLDKAWVKSVLGVLSGLVAPYWAWVTALPGPAIYLFALIGIPAGLFSWMVLTEFIRWVTLFRPPDYEAWLRPDHLNLKQAALLLADVDPLMDRMTQKPYTYFLVLKQAVMANELPCTSRPPRDHVADGSYLGVGVKLKDVAKLPAIANHKPKAIQLLEAKGE